MKPTGVIINVARGNILDPDALYKVCKDHKIYGAALDVFEPEPLPHNSPLLTCDNILMQPHTGGAGYIIYIF